LADKPAVESIEHHNLALQHHFVDMEQQRNAASLGMWLFLATEVMFFGGLFCSYLIYRYWYPKEFAIGSRALSLPLGTINTAVLICSSLTVALSIHAAQVGKRKLLVTLLLLTMLFGLAFLGVKGYEWHDEYERHHVPGLTSYDVSDLMAQYPQIQIDPVHTQMFFALYFIMTGLHALHMIVGVGLFSFITFFAWKGRYGPDYTNPLENSGLYWHFVDIVWIYLFPLLYLIDRKPLK
jgi:cytochrome c oxidase subunit 3